MGVRPQDGWSARMTMGDAFEGSIPMNEGSGQPPGEPRPLSIGALSRATRIPVETLRTWERRYGSPMPVRKPSGHRVYPAASVEHLRRVGRLLIHGHRPGEILGLSTRELDALLSLSEPAPAPVTPPAGPVPAGEDSAARIIAKMLRATADLDRQALLHELRTGWVRLGPLRFLDQVAGAFMVEVGRGWHAGTLEVRHEHFASACLSDFLRAAREPYDQQARGPRVVAAMLPGEAHEGGLLIASTLMALRPPRALPRPQHADRADRGGGRGVGRRGRRRQRLGRHAPLAFGAGRRAVAPGAAAPGRLVGRRGGSASRRQGR
jgi:DNA-binding transcriptional MerR regulator